MTAPAPAAPTGVVDPGSRGSLTLVDRVVERVAAQAATEVSRTGAPVRDRPAVTARVDGDVAVLALSLALPWPSPVAQLSRDVRGHVVARVAELTGVRAVQVDVRVTGLSVVREPRRRVV
ncbi:hypothetical protein GB931_01600 [Modestobacter sp. I12A-02628]|uniref:Asp23/Gls24 family envelope stress response protein n=1 Tax=Goekera deserti TaxID=2497753 RepID=A0A7K3WK99_9ACTN|nr:hypothetical protein [Goekera deserti]MPQ96635.1 hypothetical protein [Goekera deserti]NDI47053.1 hypothetical protein [Goekera deserti]NEL56289.1 hypothetical protein [Goekera deserti]